MFHVADLVLNIRVGGLQSVPNFAAAIIVGFQHFLLFLREIVCFRVTVQHWLGYFGNENICVFFLLPSKNNNVDLFLAQVGGEKPGFLSDLCC